MLIWNVIIFIVFLLCFFYSKSYKGIFSDIPSKEHPLRIFYPLSYFFLFKTPLKSFYMDHTEQLEQLKALYGMCNPEEMKLYHWCRKVSLIILTLLLFNTISLVSVLNAGSKGELLDGRYISRPGYGEQKKEVNLDVKIQDKSETIEKTMTVLVEERKYNEKQRKEMFDKVQNYIEKTILGENRSKDEIMYPLMLVTGMPGTGIAVEWDLGTEEIIDSKGKLHNERIPSAGVLTELTAILKYGENTAEYPIFLRVLPKQIERGEELYDNLLEAVKLRQSQSQTEGILELPAKIEEHLVYFSEKTDPRGIHLMILGTILAVMLGFVTEKELSKKLKNRELELLIDYPEIMNKFALLLGAGMTITNAWGRIAGEYSERMEKEKGKKRYAYEELLITWRELTNGIMEVTAFDNFGKRIKLMPYLKFSSLITQNLRKGSRGLLELLELEAADAFEERKELAKRLGEEAGTKLLIPMMLMLLIVLLLIMIPALMTL